MNKEEYRARLEANWWKNLATEFKDFAHKACQICGDSNPECGLNVHHLSYNHLAGPKEWEDVVVVCRNCHEIYHSVHTMPPQGRYSREEMLAHFADTVSNKGVDTHYFLKNGATDIRIWGLFVPAIVEEVNKKDRISKVRPKRNIPINVGKTRNKRRLKELKIKTNNPPHNPDLEKRLFLSANVSNKEISAHLGLDHQNITKEQRKAVISILKKRGSQHLLAELKKK